MTRSLYAIPATLCLAAAVVMAQAPAGEKPESYPVATPQPAGAPRTGQKPPATMAGNKVTYVGCVKPGTSTGTWVLENAEAQKAGAPASGAIGTSGRSMMTLHLDPAATVNLKGHANHRVEIVGMLSTGPGATAAAEPKGGEAAAGVTGPTDAKGESPTTAGGPAAAEGAGAAGAQASAHHFSVESLKMVSATCP